MWRKDLVILSPPIWKTLMGSLGSRVLSLAQSLYPVGCGISQCQPGPISTRTPRQCAAGSSWNFMEVAVVFRKGGKESRQSKSKECQLHCLQTTLGFLGGSVVKNPPALLRDKGSVPEWGRSSGEGNGNPLQYPCLRNPMDRGAWRATVHGVAKESDTT